MCGWNHYSDLSAVASCAAETCKGHDTAGILDAEQTRQLNLDKPMMDPRLSAVRTSILFIPAPTPRWLTFTFHSVQKPYKHTDVHM